MGIKDSKTLLRFETASMGFDFNSLGFYSNRLLFEIRASAPIRVSFDEFEQFLLEFTIRARDGFVQQSRKESKKNLLPIEGFEVVIHIGVISVSFFQFLSWKFMFGVEIELNWNGI